SGDASQEHLRHQRAKGRAHVTLARSPAGTIKPTRIFQSGSAKAMLPRVHMDRPEVVFLNTSGGVTGGDHLEYQLDIDRRAEATATMQTAERAYRSTGSTGRVDTHISLGAGAVLDFLPQEMILFEQSRLRRSLTVDLAADASFLFCDLFVLGRAAMGERPQELWFEDTRHVRRDGRVIYHEALVLHPKALSRREAPVLLAGANAFASIGLFSNDAADRGLLLSKAIEQAEQLGVRVGASGWNDKLVIRLAAPDLYELKKTVALIVTQLRQTALPRVWQI
ncbi:MAG: urease accessory protein UreD, partial [Pseudomonadota bacterium]